jgi:hypothetical protein
MSSLPGGIVSIYSQAGDYEISAAARDLAAVRLAKLYIIAFGFLSAVGFAIGLVISIVIPGDSFIDQSLIIPRVFTPSNSGPFLKASIFPLVEVFAIGVTGLYMLLTYTRLVDRKALFRDAILLLLVLILSAHVFLAYSNSSADADEMLRRELFFGRSPAHDAFEFLARSHAQTAAGNFFLCLASIVGLAFALHLRTVVVAPKEKLKYLQVLEAIGQMRSSEAALPAKGRPINRSLGKKYVAAAAGILVCYSLLSSFLPYSASIGVVTGLAAIPVNILVLFLLLRARQYYQTSSESYLDDDPRQPILLLRSFVDDTPVRPAAVIGPGGLGNVLDFSIETRLADHFMRFGPFLAVGSPQDKRPQLGAPRVKLADSDWQAFVTKIMEQSRMIVMLVGTTHWVGWELETVVRLGYPSQLLCIFPRPIFFGSKRGVRKSVNEQTLERLEKVKHAFQGTPWSLALANIAQPQDLFAMTFAPSGTIQAVRCSYYTKDAFDLAAQIVHLLIEDRK